MKHYDLDNKLIAARPLDTQSRAAFTDRVMASILQSEIISRSFRTIEVKPKETFIMKLRRLPIAIMILIAVLGIAGLSGTAYAIVKTIEAYQSQTTITSTTTNLSGRREVTAVFENCGVEKAKKSYDLKKDSALSVQEAEKYLLARCQLDAVEAFIRKKLETIPDYPYQGGLAILSEQALTVTAIKDGQMVLSTLGGGQYTIKTHPKTSYLEAGEPIDKAAIKSGDVITFIRGRDAAHSFLGTLEYVVKLNLPAHYYDVTAQEISLRQPCLNNPEITCVRENTHLHLVGYGNKLPDGSNEVASKELQGKIISLTPREMTLATSPSGHFTLTLKNNIVESYNSTALNKLEIGDTVTIYYAELDDNKKHIAFDELTTISLLMVKPTQQEPVSKKY